MEIMLLTGVKIKFNPVIMAFDDWLIDQLLCNLNINQSTSVQSDHFSLFACQSIFFDDIIFCFILSATSNHRIQRYYGVGWCVFGD